MSKIESLGNRILISIDEPKSGSLDTTSLTVAREKGTVLDIGPGVDLYEWPIKVGDKILFKAWAVDIVNEDGEKHYSISQETDGLIAKVR
jgi:co-chaperonin GroES (HSP10)